MLVRVTVDLETIPETLGPGWEYILATWPEHDRTTFQLIRDDMPMMGKGLGLLRFWSNWLEGCGHIPALCQAATAGSFWSIWARFLIICYTTHQHAYNILLAFINVFLWLPRYPFTFGLIHIPSCLHPSILIVAQYQWWYIIHIVDIMHIGFLRLSGKKRNLRLQVSLVSSQMEKCLMFVQFREHTVAFLFLADNRGTRWVLLLFSLLKVLRHCSVHHAWLYDYRLPASFNQFGHFPYFFTWKSQIISSSSSELLKPAHLLLTAM